ncbi:MATE family efflux transporter DinF [Flocculibacter collagenilyticus]|uniref:MATE family efflux transporter DinF n=1 Tax=Flocculibacter collagenilyticus TaxID=2744479 RepID=UPI0018F55FA0|nr:MATE family efflux transporter DinF [Flocculibacter collagenilyticus]
MAYLRFNVTEHQKILAIALPMIVSNITVPLLGLVDTAVMGHLDSEDYLAGVAVGAMITSFIFWLMGFLRMATTGLIAQAHGAKNWQHIERHCQQSIIIIVVLTILFLLLHQTIKVFALSMAGASESVTYYAGQYFDVRIWSFPAVAFNLVIMGVLLGLQNAKGPMILLIVTNLLNMLLDVVFVFGFNWDVKGVAAASLIADYVGLGFGLYLVRKVLLAAGYAIPRFNIKQAMQQNYSRFMSLNRDILIRSLCLQICFVFMTFAGARMGDNIVAANAILLNFLMLISFGLDGFAYAAEALVGKAYGERNTALIKHNVKLTLIWSVLLSALFSVFFAVFGVYIIRLMTDLPHIITTANAYFAWIIGLPLVAVWCFLFDGVFIGLTRAKDMRNSMIVSMLLGFFAVWWLSQSWGNHGLWLAMTSFMLMRGVTLAWRYRMLINNKLVE